MDKKLSKNYLDYIHSEQWRLKRREALKHYGYRCSNCGTKKRLDVHHLTYDRFKNERLSDLMILCRPCHDLAHSNIDLAKDWKAPQNWKYELPKNKKANTKLNFERERRRKLKRILKSGSKYLKKFKRK